MEVFVVLIAAHGEPGHEISFVEFADGETLQKQ